MFEGCLWGAPVSGPSAAVVCGSFPGLWCPSLVAKGTQMHCGGNVCCHWGHSTFALPIQKGFPLQQKKMKIEIFYFYKLGLIVSKYFVDGVLCLVFCCCFFALAKQ